MQFVRNIIIRGADHLVMLVVLVSELLKIKNNGDMVL